MPVLTYHEQIHNNDTVIVIGTSFVQKWLLCRARYLNFTTLSKYCTVHEYLYPIGNNYKERSRHGHFHATCYVASVLKPIRKYGIVVSSYQPFGYMQVRLMV